MIQNVNTVPEDQKSPPLPSEFRVWVNNNWVENTEERLIYGEKPYTIKEYWTDFKWWLRRKYRQRQLKEQSGRR
jgi:hypothetical protein